MQEEKNMSTLYLHIGTPKTGTTAIQFFLMNNQELLKSNGKTAIEFLDRQDGRLFYARIYCLE